MELVTARAVHAVPEQPTTGEPRYRYETKLDGFRVSVARAGTGVKLWSRRGSDLTSAFPDLAAAAELHLPPDTVLDGEAVVFLDGKLRFDQLQRRMVTRAADRLQLLPPATFVAFDVLALAGADQRHQPFSARRRQLEHMAATWSPPLELCMSTTSREEAMQWLSNAAFRRVGIEGLVVKPMASRYRGGHADWLKVKSRETVEVLVGAVTGSARRPEAAIAGVVRHGELRIVGRTSALTPVQAAELAEAITVAGDDHPWPDEIGAGVFGARQRVRIVKVRPEVVLEVTADAATDHGRFRHALRYVRVRPDMSATDIADPCPP